MYQYSIVTYVYLCKMLNIFFITTDSDLFTIPVIAFEFIFGLYFFESKVVSN